MHKSYISICVVSLLVGLVLGSIVTKVMSSPITEFEFVEDIKVLSVADWPPISETSIFYPGYDRTDVANRKLLGLFNPHGTSIVDQNLNRYLVSGSTVVKETNYRLERDASKQVFRLCGESGCMLVNKIIGHMQ